jgi:low temperature requirement protein LtrA
MVAGVIAAAGSYELAIAHPGDQIDAATACIMLGGPVLFLVGHTLFKWALWGHVPRARLAPIGALLALIPVAIVSTTLVLLALTSAVVVAAAWSSSRTQDRLAGAS